MSNLGNEESTHFLLSGLERQTGEPAHFTFHQDIAGLQGHLKTNVYLCCSSQQALCRGIYILLLFKASVPS